MNEKIKDIQSEIENLFENFNDLLFDNQLPTPIITIQSAGRKNVLGWCTTRRVWTNSDKTDERYEIAITAEHLSRPIIEIAETLVHEASHLLSLSKGIKDYSGLCYHNKRFRDTCLAHGLNCEYMDQKTGWSKTSLNEKGLEAFNKINVDVQAFDFARIAPEIKERKPRSKSKKFVYTCPSCDAEVKSKGPLNIHCNDCEHDFELTSSPMDDDGEEGGDDN